MKKRLHIPVLSLFLIQCLAVAQNTFTLKDNDLNNSPNLSFGATAFGIDYGEPNLALFVEGKLVYRFKKEKAWVKANYTYAFVDRLRARTESENYADAIPADGTQPFKDIGLSLGFNLIKREDIRLAKATFLFLRSGRNKKISIPIRKYRLYGIHGGYEKFQTILSSESTTSYTGTITESALIGQTITAQDATPMFHVDIISFGIHRQYIEHYKLQVNNNGELTDYSMKSSATLYADFLFGTNMVLDDILVPLNINAPNTNPQNSGTNKSYNFYRANINDSYRKVAIGGRIGYEKITLKPLGGMVGAEFGFRPGIIDPTYNFYFMLKLGFMFNVKAK